MPLNLAQVWNGFKFKLAGGGLAAAVQSSSTFGVSVQFQPAEGRDDHEAAVAGGSRLV
jgi:hypothetical protein